MRCPILAGREEPAARVIGDRQGGALARALVRRRRAVAAGADGDAAGASAALGAALEAGNRYPVFSALTMRLVAEAAIRDGWGAPEVLLRTTDSTFTQLRLGPAGAACRALLQAAGHPAPRRRAADGQLPAALAAAGVTTREAEVLDLIADRLPFAAFGQILGPAVQQAGLDARPAYPVEQVMTQDGTRST